MSATRRRPGTRRRPRLPARRKNWTTPKRADALRCWRRSRTGSRRRRNQRRRRHSRRSRRMADYTVLSEVGESILGVLWEEMQADPQINTLIDSEDRISLESPADLEGNDTVRLSIYLYRIAEDAYSKNRPPINNGRGQLQKPPLTLDLYYLVTPLVGLPREQQIVLGKTMQILYDRSTLEGTDLVGSLQTSGEVVRVILNPVTLEETTRVWQALEMSYRLSVCYVVRVAMISSLWQQTVVPVVEAIMDYGELESST